MTRERLTGTGVLILGLLIFFLLIPRGIDQPGSVEHAALAPDFWPKIIAAIIIVMGLLLTVKPAKEEDEESEDAGDAVPWLQRLPGLAVALGTLFAFYFLIRSSAWWCPA